MSGVLNLLLGGAMELVDDRFVQSSSSVPGGSSATIRWNTDGTNTQTPSTTGTFNWLLAGAAADYDITFHLVTSTGAGTFTGTMDTPLNLGTQRIIQLTANATAPVREGTYVITFTGGGATVGSGTWGLYCDATGG